jgi:hypothetical protein
VSDEELEKTPTKILKSPEKKAAGILSAYSKGRAARRIGAPLAV